MATEIFNSYSDFLIRENKGINGVSQDFADNNKNYIEQNETNDGCWNCYGCEYCYNCSNCLDCYKCNNCFDLEGLSSTTCV